MLLLFSPVSCMLVTDSQILSHTSNLMQFLDPGALDDNATWAVVAGEPKKSTDEPGVDHCSPVSPQGIPLLLRLLSRKVRLWCRRWRDR